MKPSRRATATAGVAIGMLTALVTTSPTSAAGGTLDGFSTADFFFVNALQTTAGTLGQVTISQSAANASTGALTAKNALSEKVLAASGAGKNAYGHAAGVSVNLGSPPGNDPQIALTRAEALSPPPQANSTNIVHVPLAPIADVTVQPDDAFAGTTQNTHSPTDFCSTVGDVISQGTTNVSAAAVASSGGVTVADLDSAVRNVSTQALVPNGAPDGFGLASVSTLNTTGLTLFKGVPGAEINIQIVAPVTLDAFASGIPGRSAVAFGDKGQTNVVKITTSGGTALLTLNQLIGGGATIDLDGLVQLDIKLTPTKQISADGTTVTAAADLVTLKVIGSPAPTAGQVGGPVGQVLNPVLTPVFSTLNSTGVFQQIDAALQSAGITKGADLRIGHFESRAQVPAGGVHCVIPVKKTADPSVVQAGSQFVYTITVDNPFGCVLNPVKLVDDITGDSGVKWSVDGTNPKADSVSHDEIVWNNIGPIAPKKSKSVQITVTALKDTSPGEFTDKAKATGVCKGGTRLGSGAVVTPATVTLTGQVTVVTPRIGGGKPLATTGMSRWPEGVAGLLIALGLTSLAIRRRRAF
jgi:hypothetical protein